MTSEVQEVLTGWDVYWITRCDAVSVAAVIVAIAAAFVGVIAGTFGAVLVEDGMKRERATALRLFKPSVFTFAFSLSVAVFIPSTKQACAILVVPAIANNAEVQGLGGDVMEAARAWLREMTPEAEGEGN